MANRLHIATTAVHVKMGVDFTVEQDYNLQILKEAKFSEFTLRDFIELSNKVRVRVYAYSDIFPPTSSAMTANGGGRTAESMHTH